jgi:hypothetical protein
MVTGHEGLNVMFESDLSLCLKTEQLLWQLTPTPTSTNHTSHRNPSHSSHRIPEIRIRHISRITLPHLSPQTLLLFPTNPTLESSLIAPAVLPHIVSLPTNNKQELQTQRNACTNCARNCKKRSQFASHAHAANWLSTHHTPAHPPP